MNLCNLCLCAIKDSPGKLPVCKKCYEDLQTLQTESRMELALAVMRNVQAQETASSLQAMIQQLEELIEASKRFQPYRMN